MLQFDRWLTGDDYAIQLEDGRRLSQASLLTAARRERSLTLKRLFVGGARRLATVISSSVTGTTEKVRVHRKVPRNPAKNICSTIDYRTDAALGHAAGIPSEAQTPSVGTGMANNANGKIAA